jgi:hypothetical protein
MKDIISINECTEAIVIPYSKYSKTVSQMRYLNQRVKILSSGNGICLCECKDGENTAFSQKELKYVHPVTKYRKLTFHDMGPSIDMALAQLYIHAGLRVHCYLPFFTYKKPGIKIYRSVLVLSRVTNIRKSREGKKKVICSVHILEGRHKGLVLSITLPIIPENTGCCLYKENRFKDDYLIECDLQKGDSVLYKRIKGE